MPPVIPFPEQSCRKQLRSLTSLRFFAAMLVVGFHCSHGLAKPLWAGDLLENGYEAVSFFFVLSGFILTYVYVPSSSREVAPRAFWTARIARICPVYFLALLVDLPRMLYSAFVAHTTGVGRTTAALITAPLFLQSWFPSVESVWNTPAWSLSVEAFFYAIFPWLVTRLVTIGRIPLLTSAFGLVILVSMVRSFAESAGAAGPAWVIALFLYWPPTHLPQFLLGMAAARLFVEAPGLAPSRAEGFAVASGAVIGTLFWSRSHLPAILLSDAVLAPLYALLIYSCAQASGRFSDALSHRLFVGLGEISYGVYILHMPLFFLWTRLLQHALNISASLIAWLFLPVLLMICTLVYLSIEKPLRRALFRGSGIMPVAAAAS